MLWRIAAGSVCGKVHFSIHRENGRKSTEKFCV
nr:MAG TPA: hypothetical protein [Caudoviricetes sp.]